MDDGNGGAGDESERGLERPVAGSFCATRTHTHAQLVPSPHAAACRVRDEARAAPARAQTPPQLLFLFSYLAQLLDRVDRLGRRVAAAAAAARALAEDALEHGGGVE